MARQAWHTLAATDRAAVRAGVARMKARNGSRTSNERDWVRSWQFWANIHGHFAPGAIPDRPGMVGVSGWTARSAAEIACWNSCVHRTDAFLSWHRIATRWFERVLRQAIGNDDFELPYWDVAAQPAIPPEFRTPTVGGVPNALYSPNRGPGINEGTTSLGPAARSAANAMLTTTRTAFRQRLETTPHGTVHCVVAGRCPNGEMGTPETAALDPLFWLHHCNIDRLVHVWEQRTGLLAVETALRFNFPDEGGVIRSINVGNNRTPAQIGYSYTEGRIS